MTAPWWHAAVVYQIYPRSFRDSSGNGIGDLGGIIAGLDHISWLGVDAVWLSPVYRSPMADFGYDIADHCAIDPLFGSLDDLDRLVDEAHRRDIRILLDLVPNHTSDEHPWFIDSRSSRTSPKRDWYVWRDPAPDGGPPNNWMAAWGDVPAWTLDEGTGQYYLHCFLDRQPDLDWSNPEVVAAMHDVVRFWLDRGVDGFRIDVVHLIGKDPELADDDPAMIPLPHTVLNHRPETHPLLRDLRSLVDAYPHQPVMVGEVFLLDTAMMADYLGDGDELHLAFNFPPLFAPWDAGIWRHHIEQTERELGRRKAWPTWALSNHDVPRHATRHRPPPSTAPVPDGAVARSAAVLLLCLRGTPFLYAGEELGLHDADIPDDCVVDPGGRDGCRAPIPWSADPPHGWANGDTWLPWPPDPRTHNVASLTADPASITHLYRQLLAERRARPSLSVGDLDLVGAADLPPGVVAWWRHAPDDPRGQVLVVVNFSGSAVDCSDLPLPEETPGRVILSSVPLPDSAIPADAQPWDRRLGPFEAVLVAWA